MFFTKKKIWVLKLLLFNALIAPTVYAELPEKIFYLSEELIIKSIQEDVYIVTHKFPWPANSMLVKCSDKTIVWVDTPYTDEATRKVLDWVQSELGDVQVVEINTGFHNDNLGGNGYLKEKGTDIYGSSLTARLLKERMESTRQQVLKWLVKPEFKKYYDVYATAQYTPPTKLFKLEDGLNLSLDGEKIEVYYPGPSHAMDNVVVYFARKKLLFAGCMVKSLNAKTLGFTGDADINQWPLALEKILSRYSQAHLVIPGHGVVGDLKLIKYTLSLF